MHIELRKAISGGESLTSDSAVSSSDSCCFDIAMSKIYVIIQEFVCESIDDATPRRRSSLVIRNDSGLVDCGLLA